MNIGSGLYTTHLNSHDKTLSYIQFKFALSQKKVKYKLIPKTL